MELSGKIIKVFPVRSGVSQKTGNTWMTQQAVLEIPDLKVPKKMVFDVFGEERIKQANMYEGDEVNVSFDIDAREFNGRWYTSIRAYSVVKLNQVQQTQPQAAPQRQIPTQPVPMQHPLFQDSEVVDDSDSLPF